MLKKVLGQDFPAGQSMYPAFLDRSTGKWDTSLYTLGNEAAGLYEDALQFWVRMGGLNKVGGSEKSPPNDKPTAELTLDNYMAKFEAAKKLLVRYSAQAGFAYVGEIHASQFVSEMNMRGSLLLSMNIIVKHE